MDGAHALRISDPKAVLAIGQGVAGQSARYAKKGDVSGIVVWGFLGEDRSQRELELLLPWTLQRICRDLSQRPDVNLVCSVEGNTTDLRFESEPAIAMNGAVVQPVRVASARNGAVLDLSNYLILPEETVPLAAYTASDFDAVFRTIPRRITFENLERNSSDPIVRMVVTVSSIEPIPPGTTMDSIWGELTAGLESIPAGPLNGGKTWPPMAGASPPENAAEPVIRKIQYIRAALVAGGVALLLVALMRRRTVAAPVRRAPGR